MDAERKGQTMYLLEKLRKSGKPVGRSAEDPAEADPRLGDGLDPRRDSDLVVPYSESYAEKIRKKKRANRMGYGRGTEEDQDEAADEPAPVTASY